MYSIKRVYVLDLCLGITVLKLQLFLIEYKSMVKIPLNMKMKHFIVNGPCMQAQSGSHWSDLIECSLPLPGACKIAVSQSN